MVSAFTRSLIKEKFLFMELDIVRVEGKEEAIRVFEVIDAMEETSEEQRGFVSLFHQAVEAFRRIELEEAQELFERCHALSQYRDGASSLYLRRIAELRATPPQLDWDKVYPLEK